jgi:Fic family protein
MEMTDKLNPHTFTFLDELDKDLKKSVLDQIKILWTYTSNAIEGNTLSLGDTKFIIEEGLTVKGKTIREHNEVIGHVRAIDIIYSILNENEITKEHLFSLHKAIIIDPIIDVYCPIGNWKNDINGVNILVDGKTKYHEFSHPDDINYLMEKWLSHFGNFKPNQNLDALIQHYASMHLSFVSIHPFFDGNGRIARLISNYPLLKSGFPPLTISKENRRKYIEILTKYHLNNKVLDSSSIELINQKDLAFIKFVEFCKNEYKEIQEILEMAKNLQKKRE